MADKNNSGITGNTKTKEATPMKEVQAELTQMKKYGVKTAQMMRFAYDNIPGSTCGTIADLLTDLTGKKVSTNHAYNVLSLHVAQKGETLRTGKTGGRKNDVSIQIMTHVREGKLLLREIAGKVGTYENYTRRVMILNGINPKEYNESVRNSR